MKRFIKLIAVIISLMMFISIVSCSEDTTEKRPDIQMETQSPESNGDEKSKADPRDKFEAFDLGGRTIKVSSWWQVVPHSNMSQPDPASSLPEHIAKYNNLKRVEEKYNCRIEFINVPWGELRSKLVTSVMSGTPYADVTFLPMNFAVPSIANNLLMSISEYALPNSDVFTDNIAVQSLGHLLDGEYGVAPVGIPVNGVFMAYNKSILKDIGMDSPSEIYNNNPDNWNWDKFLEYAKAATADTDGDGNVDRFGYGGFINYAISNFIIANDGFVFDDFNGKQGLDNPNTMEALEFINNLYNVDKVVYNAGEDIWDYDANFNAYREGRILFFPLVSWMLSEVNELPYDYSIVPFPKGPENKSGKTCSITHDGFYIPKGVEEPEKVYQVLEELLWFFGDDPDIRDDSTMEWLEQQWLIEEDLKIAIEVSANQSKIELYDFVPGFPMGDVIGAVLSGDMTVAQAVEANKQVAQDAIDQLLSKE
ncbi:UNVERIFIED_CONTAM: multiple sugar transport system substrate-binding protein [Acetivibrio alkalicellulosi]